MTQEIPNLYQVTQRKARFGHNDWVYWRDRNGIAHAERKSIESVKRCLLDCGTNGSWTLIGANDGNGLKGTWRIGINLLAHMRLGFY